MEVQGGLLNDENVCTFSKDDLNNDCSFEEHGACWVRCPVYRINLIKTDIIKTVDMETEFSIGGMRWKEISI